MHHRIAKSTLTAAMVCAIATAAHAAMTISNAKTKNVNCASGVCTPTGGNANLNTASFKPCSQHRM